MRRLLLTLTLIAAPTLAWAQAPTNQPPITAVRFVTSGGVAPITNDILLTNITGPAACAPTVTGVVHNPTAIEYKLSPTDTTCFRYVDTPGGPLIGLPVGGTVYTSTLAYVAGTLVGPASAVSNPFDRPGTAPTVAPAAVRVLP